MANANEKTRIDIAVAGLGRTGWRNHLLNLAKLGDMFRITAVADQLEERRNEAESQFGCRSHATLDDLLAKETPSWIVIATPTFLHLDQTTSALSKGWNVICEKPLAASVDEIRAMMAAAEKHGRTLTAVQQHRYAADFVKVREVIDSGVLGRIVQIRSCMNGFNRRWDWQTLQKNGGGTLNNTGPHPLDQMLQLFGPDKPEVSCHMDRFISVGDADDHVKLVLRGKNSPTIDLEVSSVDALGDRKWKVQGTSGGLEGSATHLKWRFFDPTLLPTRQIDDGPPADRGYHREEFPWQSAEWQEPAGPESAHTTYYRDLHDRLSKGLPPRITALDALRVAEVIAECRRDSTRVHGSQV